MYYKLGLIGENISYSLSPMIHQWGLEQCGLKGEYLLYDMNQTDAEKFFKDKIYDLHGLNVTTPYKYLASKFCSNIQGLGSTEPVNAVVTDNKVLFGYNTDIRGFEFAYSSVLDRIKNLNTGKALIIGSGGAASAVLIALRRRIPSLSIFISSSKLEAANQRFKDFYGDPEVISHPVATNTLELFDIVIQATPVGSMKVPGMPLLPPFKFKDGAIVIDLIYAPFETEFLKQAKIQNTITENGLSMLIAQAAASFDLWMEVKFPLEKAMLELYPILKQKL